jgi:hypothetical protein
VKNEEQPFSPFLFLFQQRSARNEYSDDEDGAVFVYDLAALPSLTTPQPTTTAPSICEKLQLAQTDRENRTTKNRHQKRRKCTSLSREVVG